MARYATIRRGKVRFPIGSAEDRFLHARHLPHSHVTTRPGKPKRIERFDARPRRRKKED